MRLQFSCQLNVVVVVPGKPGIAWTPVGVRSEPRPPACSNWEVLDDGETGGLILLSGQNRMVVVIAPETASDFRRLDVPLR